MSWQELKINEDQHLSIEISDINSDDIHIYAEVMSDNSS